MPQTDTAARAPGTPPPQTTTIRRAVSPEIAGNIREEDEAMAATIETARAIVSAASSAAKACIEGAQARRSAALRPILRQLGIDDGTVVGTEGFGLDTMLVIELPAITPSTTPPNAEAPA